MTFRVRCGILYIVKVINAKMKGNDFMTIAEVVNKAKGCIVRVQVMRDGYTQFIANDETTNCLLLGRIKNTPVEHIKVEHENEVDIIHIYGVNYLNYHH